MVARARRGRTTLGCLFTLLIVAYLGYVAVHVVPPYFRYFRYQDAMEQAARFANRTSDEAIVGRLQALADSLGLPDEARRVTVRRGRDSIYISASYTETVELPAMVRDIEFTAHAARAF